jgi:UPF0755 protein
MRRLIGAVVLLAVAAGLAGVVWLVRFATTPLDVPASARDLQVKKGRTLKGLSMELAAAGVFAEPWSFLWLGRLLGRAGDIQAGYYALPSRLTPYRLLEMIANGEVTETQITFIEGWTFGQIRAALDAHPLVVHDTVGLSDLEILRRIEAVDSQPEGWFFPDTYRFHPGSSDLKILAQAHRTMQARLHELWETRASGLPYATPYQALIMASIVEKETGVESERAMIAAVFVNRLRRQMRLQTDPSVIYGLGARFDGNLRKRDLETDSPYNTYTRAGLPPTPIAMPGRNALEAALRPASSKALYFVARGDGSSQFSDNLVDHNRAVRKYQLGQ